MPAATLTSKGQVTIPRSVREALQLKAGDRVDFVPVGPDRFEIVPAVHSVSELKGMFKAKAKRPVSVEEMNAAIAKKGACAK